MIKNLFHLPLLKLMVQRQQEDQPKQGFSDKIKDSEQMWHFGHCCESLKIMWQQSKLLFVLVEQFTGELHQL